MQKFQHFQTLYEIFFSCLQQSSSFCMSDSSGQLPWFRFFHRGKLPYFIAGAPRHKQGIHGQVLFKHDQFILFFGQVDELTVYIQSLFVKSACDPNPNQKVCKYSDQLFVASRPEAESTDQRPYHRPEKCRNLVKVFHVKMFTTSRKIDIDQ